MALCSLLLAEPFVTAPEMQNSFSGPFSLCASLSLPLLFIVVHTRIFSVNGSISPWLGEEHVERKRERGARGSTSITRCAIIVYNNNFWHTQKRDVPCGCIINEFCGNCQLLCLLINANEIFVFVFVFIFSLSIFGIENAKMLTNPETK